jgi:hypothetical protein
VKGQKRVYTYYDAVSRDILHELSDNEVIVSYDPNALERVAILDDAGHFLTWAREKELMKMTSGDAETSERIAESMADRHHLEKQTREQVEAITRTARSIGAVSPIEAMDKRAKNSFRQSPDIEAVLTHKPTPAPTDAPAPQITSGQAARLLLERNGKK